MWNSTDVFRILILKLRECLNHTGGLFSSMVKVAVMANTLNAQFMVIDSAPALCRISLKCRKTEKQRKPKRSFCVSIFI